jgi:transposase
VRTERIPNGFSHFTFSDTALECEMESIGTIMKTDGRKLDRKMLKEMRSMAIKRMAEGERPDAVATSFGMHQTWAYKLRKRANTEEFELGVSSKGTGRPRKLTVAQEWQVFRWLNGKTPGIYRLNSALWTRLLVRDLIRRKFGVRLSLPSVGAIFLRLGLRPPKFLQAAYRRDPEAIGRWHDETYPAIVRQASETQADICFWDESGFRTDTEGEKTSDVQGETLVLQVSGQQQSLRAASAVNIKGAFWFATYQGTLNGESFAELLKKLMHYRKKPLHLVLDGLPAHRTAVVEDYVSSTDGKLILHFLPSHAPESFMRLS